MNTFDELARLILKRLGTGDDAMWQGSTGTRPAISSQALFEEMQRVTAPSVLILDEFDRIRSESVRRDVANLIKTLSNRAWDAVHRVVVVGVGPSAEAILGQHESFGRCTPQLRIGPLIQNHVKRFLEKAGEELSVRIPEQIVSSIAKDSAGIPWYPHIIGFEMIISLLARDNHSRSVNEDDYAKAVRVAGHEAFRDILRSHKKVVYRLTADEKKVLKEVCSVHTALTKREIKERVLKHTDVSPNQFEDVWHTLQEKKWLWYLVDERVKFPLPLMKTRLRMLIGWWRPRASRRRTAEDSRQGKLFD